MCLGFRWMELQLAVNVLMVADYFRLEVSPSDYKLRFSPLPSMKPNKKLRFRIAESPNEGTRYASERTQESGIVALTWERDAVAPPVSPSLTA